MSEPILLVERDGALATVTLNRPQSLNALSRELSRKIGETFRALEEEGKVRVVILTGAGRAFSAGVDLKELGRDGFKSEDTVSGPDFMKAGIAAFSGPIIGAINGVAITGGFELALACDFLIGSTEARFADTHARVGAIPGWGISQILPRLIGINRAKELSFTGNFISADEAYRIGLLNRVVAPEELLPHCRALARDMLTIAPEMLRSYKRLIDDGWAIDFGAAMSLERERSRAWNATIAPADIESRREAIRKRGQSQKDGL